MTVTTRQTLRDSDQIKSILTDLGYELMDFGSCWRTKALYRDGDNPAAIQIYKNTGVWIDFADGAQGLPFELLIQKTIGDKRRSNQIVKSIGKKPNKNEVLSFSKKEKNLVTMDKVYSESCLQSLFPNYLHFKERGISDEVQASFKMGLATNNELKMYRRLTFPIYDMNGKIIGFSGRSIDENAFIKWKHVGKKTKWVYPAFVPMKLSVDECIDNSCEVFLVESIGDCMAMHDHGIKETLVTFGVNISPSLLSYLSGKELNRITIVPNNDRGSKKNNGVIGGIKNFLKLSRHFDLDILCIKTPPDKKNDMLDAVKTSDIRGWARESVDHQKMLDGILSFIDKNKHEFKREENYIKKLRKQINARKT